MQGRLLGGPINEARALSMPGPAIQHLLGLLRQWLLLRGALLPAQDTTQAQFAWKARDGSGVQRVHTRNVQLAPYLELGA